MKPGNEKLIAIHRNKTIVYDEPFNIWRVEEDGIEADSLAAARRAVDKLLLDERKTGRVGAKHLGWAYPGGVSLEDCEVTSIVNDDDKQAWIVAGGKREKVSIDRLVPPTDDNLALIALAIAADKRTQKAKTEAAVAWAAVPRFTSATLLAARKKAPDA